MRGYAMGAEDAGVIDPARVSHGGVKIGRVEFAAGNMARVRLERSLDDGDGLQIRTAQGDAAAADSTAAADGTAEQEPTESAAP